MYLKELKILPADEEKNNIIAIINQNEGYMNGFVFRNEN